MRRWIKFNAQIESFELKISKGMGVPYVSAKLATGQWVSFVAQHQPQVKYYLHELGWPVKAEGIAELVELAQRLKLMLPWKQRIRCASSGEFYVDTSFDPAEEQELLDKCDEYSHSG